MGIQYVLRNYLDKKTSNTKIAWQKLAQKFWGKNKPILILMDVAEKNTEKRKKNDQKITEKKWLTSRLVWVHAQVFRSRVKLFSVRDL